MIYKFKSSATGDVIMLGPNGDEVLRLIGKQPAPKGVVRAADMPAALSALTIAVADEDGRRKQLEAEAAQKGHHLQAPDGVTLHQRVFPFLEMLKEAQAEGADIVWGV